MPEAVEAEKEAFNETKTRMKASIGPAGARPHLDPRTLNHMLLWLPLEHVTGGPAPSCRPCRAEWWKIERKRNRRRRKRMRD
jgi:hypothetical protein